MLKVKENNQITRIIILVDFTVKKLLYPIGLTKATKRYTARVVRKKTDAIIMIMDVHITTDEVVNRLSSYVTCNCVTYVFLAHRR